VTKVDVMRQIKILCIFDVVTWLIKKFDTSLFSGTILGNPHPIIALNYWHHVEDCRLAPSEFRSSISTTVTSDSSDTQFQCDNFKHTFSVHFRFKHTQFQSWCQDYSSLTVSLESGFVEYNKHLEQLWSFFARTHTYAKTQCWISCGLLAYMDHMLSCWEVLVRVVACSSLRYTSSSF
jgi:hypothetical protein